MGNPIESGSEGGHHNLRRLNDEWLTSSSFPVVSLNWVVHFNLPGILKEDNSVFGSDYDGM